jgi:5-methyltetrahydrofolate--homocysteine methyltransferase
MQGDEAILDEMSGSLQEGDEDRVRELAGAAIAAGIPPERILQRGLLDGMAVVGERFRSREIFLPDVLLAARAMRAAMDLVGPLLARSDVPARAKVVLGTVRGDIHDIGKNLVGIMLQGAGFEVIDLGTDVPPERFVEAAVESGAPVIGLSALLTTTMAGMQDVIGLLESRGLRGRVAVIVGGAPVTSGFAREIGADACAFDAASAVERVKALTGG